MKVRSTIRPESIEIMPTYVLITSNIVPYEEEIDGHISSGFEYDCQKYTKDEYLLYQSEKIASLEEELEAAKILLGVD